MPRVLVIEDDIWFNGVKARDIIFNESNINITVELPSIRDNPVRYTFNLGSIQATSSLDTLSSGSNKDVRSVLREKEFRIRYNSNSEDLMIYA